MRPATAARGFEYRDEVFMAGIDEQLQEKLAEHVVALRKANKRIAELEAAARSNGPIGQLRRELWLRVYMHHCEYAGATTPKCAAAADAALALMDERFG